MYRLNLSALFCNGRGAGFVPEIPSTLIIRSMRFYEYTWFGARFHPSYIYIYMLDTSGTEHCCSEAGGTSCTVDVLHTCL